MHKFRNLNQSTRSPLRPLRRLALLPLSFFALSGCGTQPEESPRPVAHPYAGSTITVAVVGDPTAGETVAAVKGDWSERSGAEVKIESKPIDPADKSIAADLFLFRGDRFADLVAAGRLGEIPDSFVRPAVKKKSDSHSAGESSPPRSIANDSTSPADPLSFAQIPIGIREQVLKFGGIRRALPYGGSALVLAYRREAFSDPELKAEAEKAGIVLAPPTTWDRLDELAKFLNGRDWDHDGTPNQGIALPLGEDHEGVGLAVLLARAASLGLHRDQFCFLFNPTTLEPWIDKPPFVEALSKIASLRDFGPERMTEFNAEAARAAFRSGKTAMLIDRAELAPRWTDRKKPVQVGVAPLPGSKRVYDPDRKIWETIDEPNLPVRLPYGGGLLIGVSAEITGKQREAAFDLLGYLVSPDVADRIVLDRADPVVPVRLDAIARGLPDPREAVGVDSRSWAKAVEATWNATVVTVDPRLPNTLGYLADLETARVKAAHGESAQSALNAAAQAWVDRINKVKKEDTLTSYRGGLNTVPIPNETRRDLP